MHQLWEVLNLTSSFKWLGEIWSVVDIHNREKHHGGEKIMAQNERTGCVESFNIYCLVEPVGIDMGKGQ